MKIFVYVVCILFSIPAVAKLDTTCHTWPMNMAKIWLQDKQIVNQKDLVNDKTQFKLLASEALGQGQYTDVYFFSFFDRDGKQYDLISQNVSSNKECSISNVNFYLISQYKINY